MTLKISLKAARINAGLTQEAVAAMLKKSKVTIINWEKGKTSIDKGNFDALCRLYSVDEDNIFLPSIATKSKQKGD
ncbi:helix-turn-helix transcriptional regulator [Phascolarctobacterium faecium]|jgi:transcriptional regulator with XRE-family HTH domain|uniref:helix-turn-helix transcriptional regulator n=1 Tax=Phascolarctobacterium faecium TaxID=33025 RepID=UPI00206F0E8F|nr:helix-turn-helix transcriptional regulator [Phascolarctobacterium faecium]DAY04432.1 MAG TPA: helix-turn-helix domain protein [Caudoviricetes sp.]